MLGWTLVLTHNVSAYPCQGHRIAMNEVALNTPAEQLSSLAVMTTATPDHTQCTPS